MINANPPNSRSKAKGILHLVAVIVLAGILTLSFFLVLPIIQAISASTRPDTMLQKADAVNLPPPPEPMEEPPEEEPEPEEEPPELEEMSQPLDLSQLSLALNPGNGSGFSGADFAVNLSAKIGTDTGMKGLVDFQQLEQKPRPIYQANPVFTPRMRKRAPATVWIVFVVDERGRVVNPRVQKSEDPVFERSALVAIKKWKFEPGKKNGKPVARKMRVPISFPKR